MAVLREPFGKFAGGGGLAGALQADNHPDGRRTRGKQRFGVFAKKCSEFVADNFQNLLIRRKLEHDFTAERLAANVGEQFFHNTDRDVAFEHGVANFGESGVQVLFGELALAAEILECALKLLCKVFEHWQLARYSSAQFYGWNVARS